MRKASIRLQELRRKIYSKAKTEKDWKFWGLYCHLCKKEVLEEAYRLAKANEGAPGINGKGFEDIEAEGMDGFLEGIRQELLGRTYRPMSNRRVEIPKEEGKIRVLGIPTVRDRVVQGTLRLILEPIFEADFRGSSYGYRPRRHAHQAIDRVTRGILHGLTRVVDLDLSGYFDTLRHEWVVRFIEHRIADRRIVRLIQKWLNAGVLEEGKRIRKDEGTVQGGSISPLLSNIYLHYVFDWWVHWWRRHRANGDVIVVRFANDWVAGFQYQSDAQKFLRELKERFARFGLELHSEKTRLIEFGRFAVQSRLARGQGKPETFDFLGFTHICSNTRGGKFTVRRKTVRKRWQNKLKEVSRELRTRMHRPVPEQGAYLKSVLLGHMRYYAVPLNGRSVDAFRYALQRVWWKVLKRRSQKHNLPWKRMERLIAAWFPSVHICHPYPSQRVRV